MSTASPADGRERLVDWIDQSPTEIRTERFITANDGDNSTSMSDHTNPDVWLPPDSSRLEGNYGMHFGYSLLGLDIDYHDVFHESGAADALPLDDAFSVKTAHAEEDPSAYYFAVRDDEAMREYIDAITSGKHPNGDVGFGEISYGGLMFIGPGSQRDAEKCESGHCNGECEGADGGIYEIANIGTGDPLTVDDLREALTMVDDYDTDDTDDFEEVSTATATNAATEEGGGADGVSPVPDDLDTDYPGCYAAALWFREHPEKANTNHHDINKACGYLGARVHGMDLESHLGDLKEHSPDGYFDRQKTKSNLKDIRKRLQEPTDPDAPAKERPPSLETLSQWGILESDQCSDPDCFIHDTTTSATARATEESDGLPTPSAFSLSDGQYGYWSGSGDEKEFDRFASFQLEARSFLRNGDGEEVALTVHPKTGDTYDVTVPFSVFNSVQEFKDEVVTHRGTIFEGGHSSLNALRLFVGQQDAPTRTPTDQLGLHGDEWVTPAGSIGPDGWVEEHTSELQSQP